MENNNPRIVVDTNVITSSLIFGGIPEKLIKKIIKKNIRICISHQLLSELTDVLRKKFDFSENRLKVLRKQIVEISNISYPKKEIKIVRDVADNKVIEAAIEAKCNFIITGDKDLLVLKKYKNILIVTPFEFLKLHL